MLLHPLLIYALLLLSCCQSSNRQPAKFSRVMMTIEYHISVGDPLTRSKKEQIQQIIAATFQEIDDLYNKWNPNSELSRFNRHPARVPFTLSPELYHFLLRLDRLVCLSEGRFDPTIEPLQKLWQEKMEEGGEPGTQELDALKSCIGWNTIHLADGMIWKEDGRTKMDLGGVAKGLCVDLLVDRLNQAGLHHLFIEWGGEIRTLGEHPSGRPWHVYIRRLADSDPSAAIAQLDITDQALATSGDYFQYWEIFPQQGGKKTYCHIFNPKTLAPLEVKTGSIASASLLADDCVTADALAKVLMMFDSVEEAKDWLEKVKQELPNVECWLVQNDRKS